MFVFTQLFYHIVQLYYQVDNTLPDDGRLARCSLTPCQRFPLERLTSQKRSCLLSWADGRRHPQKGSEGAYCGKSRLLWTASSPKTGPKWVCRGLIDLSTISNGSTVRSTPMSCKNFVRCRPFYRQHSYQIWSESTRIIRKFTLSRLLHSPKKSDII